MVNEILLQSKNFLLNRCVINKYILVLFLLKKVFGEKQTKHFQSLWEDSMLSDGPKRIVVIKDIQSNMIEEAILILKNGSVVSSESHKGLSLNKDKAKKTDFLLKEAEIIIDHYLKENKACFQTKTRRESRKKLPMNKLRISAVINIILIGSLLALVLMITKLI